MSTHLVTTQNSFPDMSVVGAYRAAFCAAVKRTIGLIEAETAALRNGHHGELRAFEHRKSQALLDLSRSHAVLPEGLEDEEIRANLQELRTALASNMALLDHHMKAVKEITDLLAQTLLEADSDGTYSPKGGEHHNV